MIALAITLFVAEAFTPTFGALVAGGVVVFVLGSALLFDAPGVDIPWIAIVTLAVATGGFTLAGQQLWAGGPAAACHGRRGSADRPHGHGA